MADRALFLAQFPGEETTKRTYDYMLGYLEAERPLIDYSPLTFVELVNSRKWSNPTARLALSALKAFLRWKRVDSPMLNFRIPKRQSQPGRRLTLGQRDRLLAAAAAGRHPKRDTAIIRLMWDSLIRSFEVVEARTDRLDLEQRELLLLTKAASGKGRQWEVKRFSNETADALREWLSVSPGGAQLFGLGKDGLACLFKRLSARAGFKVSGHDLRRGGASYQVERGVPDRLVMLAGGWKSHDVFQRYTIGAELRALDGLLWGEK